MRTRIIDWIMYSAATLAVCFCIATAFAAERQAKEELQQQEQEHRLVSMQRPVLSSCKNGVCQVAKGIKQNKPVRSAVKTTVRRGLFWRLRRR